MRADLIRGSVAGVLMLVVSLSLVPADANAKEPWERFDFPELGEVQIPDYERHVLENGLTVFLLEDDKWPLVEGRIMVRTGAPFEPPEKVGLASVTGNVLRTGGTETIPADELDMTLERMGAYIESSIGNTSGSIDFSFLTRTADRGLELVADVVRRPVFAQDKIDVAIEGERASVARRNDDLNQIVARELRQAVWGDDHPYARDTEYATLEAITRDDVVEFYEYFYHPDNMMIAVWGDIDSDAMLARIEELFGDWPAGQPMVPPLPNEPNVENPSRRVLVADKADVNQTRFAMGHVGMLAKDPDYYAMRVANRILGGSFGARLFNEVRTERGLAYNVGSSAGVGFSSPGMFQAYCGTKSESTEEAVGVVLETVQTMREEPVDEEELSDAKNGLLEADVFNYVNPEQVLQRKMRLEYLGYPDDFLETFNEKVRAIDTEDVLSVMERRVNPEDFAIVAVGRTSDWDGDLSSFGPVEELDISIPEPEGPEFPEPTDETVEKGRAILAAAQEAHGGSALADLASVKRTASMNMKVQGMALDLTVTETVVYPDRALTEIETPFGGQTMAVGPESGWAKSPQGLVDMDSETYASQQREIIADPLYVLGHFDQFPVQQLPSEDVDGVAADVVLVWIDDAADKWKKFYFDPSSHVLLRTQSKQRNMMTQVMGIGHVDFSGVKNVDGIMVPHEQVGYFDDEKLYDLTVESIEVGPTIDMSVFEKPAS